MKRPEERVSKLVDGLLAQLYPKLAEFEQAIAGREYLLGEFTPADVSVAVQTFSFVDPLGMDLARWPNVKAWTDRCRARPARQKVEALVAAHAKRFVATSAAQLHCREAGAGVDLADLPLRPGPPPAAARAARAAAARIPTDYRDTCRARCG
jgi:hypothetical protein